jgi:hypothetical protein
MPSMGSYLSKIKKLQTLQNEFLRIVFKVPWRMRNKQLHNDIEIPYLDIRIKDKFKKFHAKQLN